MCVVRSCVTATFSDLGRRGGRLCGAIHIPQFFPQIHVCAIMSAKYKSILEISQRARKRRLITVPSRVEIKEPSVDITDDSNDVSGEVNYDLPSRESRDSNDIPREDLPSREFTFPETNNDNDIHKSDIQFLKSWAAQYHIQKNAISDLLKFLKSRGFPNLPTDYRSLLSTPKSHSIVELFPGHYSHIGVKKALDYYVMHSTNNIEKLSINVNVDGVPISESPPKSFWLILLELTGGNCSQKIFVAGVYLGAKKPQSFTDFLDPFITELGAVLENYIFHDRVIPLEIGCIVCDAPARNSCLGTKSYTGYFGCGRCTEKGESLHHRMVITKIHDLEKRTDESFRSKKQIEHHNYDSPFLKLKIDMIEQFPLDYLHTLNLGVAKKILNMICFGDEKSDVRPAPNKDIEAISERLETIAKFQPSEFQRKCRTLRELYNFKGTEYRNLILYILPVAAKNILREDVYTNIMLLHAATTILVDPIICRTHSRIAQTCLEEFVKTFRDLYGPEHIVYNVHSLLHIVDDVLVHGCLDSYSAFPFESFMSVIKAMLNGNNNSLAQITYRVEESYSRDPKPTKEFDYNLNSHDKNTNRYHEIVFPSFKLNNKMKDQWFFSKEKNIYKFEYVLRGSNIEICARKVKHLETFYSSPFDSTFINIFESDGDLSGITSLGIDDVMSKIFAMPHGKRFVFAPLRHSMSIP